MANLDLHYVDPRLVDLYDLDNHRGDDTDLYLSLADELDARVIIDLGCGTGEILVASSALRFRTLKNWPLPGPAPDSTLSTSTATGTASRLRVRAASWCSSSVVTE